jgi:hypothetical protein
MTRGFNAAQRAYDSSSPDEYVEIVCHACDATVAEWSCNDQESRAARRDRAIAIEAWHETHGDGPHLCIDCDDDE